MRRRSLSLRLAAWLAIAIAVYLFLTLMLGLAWGNDRDAPAFVRSLLYFSQGLMPPALVLAPCACVGLLILHWATQTLAELRRIRRALDRIAAIKEQQRSIN